MGGVGGLKGTSRRIPCLVSAVFAVTFGVIPGVAGFNSEAATTTPWSNGSLLSGRSVALNSGNALSFGQTTCAVLEATCFKGGTYAGSGWQWDSQALPLIGGQAVDIWMASSTRAYAAGRDATGTLAVVWIGNLLGGTWTWSSPRPVAPIVAGSEISLVASFFRPSLQRGDDHVWIAYRGPVGTTVKKRLSRSTDGGLTFRHLDISDDGATSGIHLAPIRSANSVLAVVRDLDPATGSLKIESKEIVTDPYSPAISLGDTRLVSFGPGLGGVDIVEDGTWLSSKFHLVFTKTDSGVTALEYCSMNYYADAGGGYSDGWDCSFEVAPDILFQPGGSTFGLGLDNSRLVAVYIPAGGASSNPLKVALRLRYDGAWTEERAGSSGPADQVSLAPNGHDNRMLMVFRDSDSGAIVSDAIDLPAIVSPISFSKSVISRVSGCDRTTVSTSPFQEPVTWTLSIRDSTDAIVRTTSSTQASEAAVAWPWDGRDSNLNQVPEGLYAAELRVTDSANWVVTKRSLAISVDLTPPQVKASGPFSFDNMVFSPNGDSIKDTTKATARFNELSNATLSFQAADAAVVRVLIGLKGFALWERGHTGLIWDGRDEHGVVVPDGTYRAVLALTDAACNVAPEAGTKDIVVDTASP